MDKIRNKDLFDALSALTQKGLEYIEAAAEEKMPLVMMESVWVREGTFYRRTHRSRYLWHEIVHRATDAMKCTREYTRVVEAIEADEIMSSQLDAEVGTSVCIGMNQQDGFVFGPLYTFLHDSEVCEFDETVFRREYRKVEASYYSNEIEFMMVTPLGGFFTDIERIELGDGLCVVELSEAEIIELLGYGMRIGNSYLGDNNVGTVHRFAIKRKLCLPKVVGRSRLEKQSPHPFNREKEDSIVDALRVFKKGRVSRLNSITKSESCFFDGVCYESGRPWRPFMRDEFKLVDGEKDSFLEFWRSYADFQIPKKNFLDVAIRRFSQSSERESIEDQIIDLLISAEALFLSSGGSFQGELKYRLSHRAAMFLEDMPQRQKDVFYFMKNVYDARSAIVHGAAPKLPTGQTLEGFCMDIEALMRRAIQKQIHTDSPSHRIKWDEIVFPER